MLPTAAAALVPRGLKLPAGGVLSPGSASPANRSPHHAQSSRSIDSNSNSVVVVQSHCINILGVDDAGGRVPSSDRAERVCRAGVGDARLGGISATLNGARNAATALLLPEQHGGGDDAGVGGNVTALYAITCRRDRRHCGQVVPERARIIISFQSRTVGRFLTGSARSIPRKKSRCTTGIRIKPTISVLSIRRLLTANMGRRFRTQDRKSMFHAAADILWQPPDAALLLQDKDSNNKKRIDNNHTNSVRGGYGGDVSVGMTVAATAARYGQYYFDWRGSSPAAATDTGNDATTRAAAANDVCDGTQVTNFCAVAAALEAVAVVGRCRVLYSFVCKRVTQKRAISHEPTNVPVSSQTTAARGSCQSCHLRSGRLRALLWRGR